MEIVDKKFVVDFGVKATLTISSATEMSFHIRDTSEHCCPDPGSPGAEGLHEPDKTRRRIFACNRNYTTDN